MERRTSTTRGLRAGAVALGLAMAGLMTGGGTAGAAILPLAQMKAQGQVIITGYQSDIGSLDNLFDGDWNSLCRSQNVNPVAVTFEFVTPQALGAMRIRFNDGTGHRWSLEGADTLADLNGKTGSYVEALAPVNEISASPYQWREFNQTPKTRKFWRVNAERTTGDDYVHIYEIDLQSPEPETTIVVNGNPVRVNTVLVTPALGRLATGQQLQFTAKASLSYGLQTYTVTGLAAWSTTPGGLATFGSGATAGRATGAAAGTGEVVATLNGMVSGRASLTVREARPLDLNVGYIQRTPEYERFRVDFTADQRILPGTENNQMWPAAGDEVTYTAKLLNKGDVAAVNVPYAWYWNGRKVAEGVVAAVPAGGFVNVNYVGLWPEDEVQTVNVPAGAQVLHPKQLERALHGGPEGKGNRIRFVADPGNTLGEAVRSNNAVEDYIGAASFRFFMEQASYDHFNNIKSFRETYSAEDWAQGQLLGLQRRMRESGTEQKVRLTELVVVPDGALDPGGTHEPKTGIDWKADSRWGFIWPEDYAKRYAKRIENALVHELGHQMGMIDIYNYDIATQNTLIRLNGELVAGTARMPLVSPWNVYYGNQTIFHQNGVALVDTTRRGVMAGPSERFFGPGDVAGFNRNLGARRGFFGDYLSAVQQGDIKIRVKNQNGTAVVADLRVFQRDYTNGTVPNAPKFVGTTDAQGTWTFPKVTSALWTQGAVAVNNPWSHWRNGVMYRGPEAVGGNAPLIIEITFGTSTRITEYHFFDVDLLNIAMAAGQTQDYTIDLTTYFSRRTNRSPVINFSTGDTITMNEGETATVQVTATDQDGDPIQLSMTGLDNATFTATGPASGTVVFKPDSLNVTQYFVDGNWDDESQSVLISAWDGKVKINKRLNFRVRDVDGLGFVREWAVVTPCQADFNHDGYVDDVDFVLFAQAYDLFTCTGACAEDMNGDGLVDDVDFVLFAQGYDAYACPG